MKNIFTWLFAIALCATLRAEVPALTGRVNDYASLLSSSDSSALEQKLADFESKTTTQIVVVTVKSLKGETIETFAEAAFNAWKLGQKGRDNGVLLAVAREERKVRIEVGYGLEGKLTDLLSKEILLKDFTPNSKQEKWSLAITQTSDSIMKAVRGEYKASNNNGEFAILDISIWFWVIAGVIVLIISFALENPLTQFISGLIGTAVVGGFFLTLGYLLIAAIVGGILAILAKPILFAIADSDSGGGGGGGGGGSSFSGGGGSSGGGGASADA